MAGKEKWPNNLDAQSQIIGAVLNRLLQSGVARISLSIDEFSEDLKKAGYPDKFDANDLFVDIAVWLSAEGIVRYGGLSEGTNGEAVVDDCHITAKGIHLLNSKLEVLGGKSAAEVLSSDSPSNHVKIGSLIGGILGGFTKSIS